MQDENRCQYSFAYRDAHTIDEIGIREANKQSMEDVILSLLQFTEDDDEIEIFIDGCDNYTFDSIEAEYIFARKSKKTSNKGKTGKDLSSSITETDGFCRDDWTRAEQDFSWPTETGLARNDRSEHSRENKTVIAYHIQWDLLFPQISAASIIAKVIRDRMMCEYSEDFPEYGFHLHKGYGTRRHSEMMINYGISPIHRKSYAPVKALILRDS